MDFGKYSRQGSEEEKIGGFVAIITIGERVADLESDVKRLSDKIDSKLNEMIDLVRVATKRTPAQLANDIKLRKK